MPSAMKPSRYTPEQLSGDLKRDMANMVTTQHPILPHAGPSITAANIFPTIKYCKKPTNTHIHVCIHEKAEGRSVLQGF